VTKLDAGPRTSRRNADVRETRKNLVRAAAAAFERDGFEGTNSNAIAREAGYSPGTFYKHFPDKTAIFVAAYRDWVAEEWRAIARVMQTPGSASKRAHAVVEVVVDLHRRWSGFRAELRALTARDRTIRRVHALDRKNQLAKLAALGGATPEEDAIFLLTVERIADAIAWGEPALLGVDEQRVIDSLVELVARRLSQGVAGGPSG
jgi:AcrR family transcriptional regulator